MEHLDVADLKRLLHKNQISLADFCRYSLAASRRAAQARPILSFTPLYGQNGLKLLSIVNNIVNTYCGMCQYPIKILTVFRINTFGGP